MTAQRRRLALWYAWHDLTEPLARWQTLLLIGNVALLVGLCLWLAGLLVGYERIQRARLRGVPAALCLWAGDGLRGSPLNVDGVGRLTAAVGREAPGAEVWPFHERYFDWPRKDSELTQRLRGRTIAGGDPFFRGDAYPLAVDRRKSSTWSGAIVTRFLLTALDHDPDAPPDELVLRVGWADTPFAIPVVAVTAAELPLGGQFVLTDDMYERLRVVEEFNPPVGRVASGVVPPGWPDPRALPKDVDRYLKEQERVVAVNPVTTDAGPVVWEFDAGDKIAMYRWRFILRTVAELLGGNPNGPFVRGLSQNEVAETPPGTPPPPRAFDRAAVYVPDDAALERTAEVVKSAGLPVKDQAESVAKAKALARSVSFFRQALAVIVFAFGAQFATNVFVIQRLRARLKMSEIGMLKAMGIDEQLLRAIYAYEAWGVWLGSAAAGVGVGLLALYAFATWLADTPQERSAAFACPVWLVALVLAGAWAVCQFGTLRATREVRQMPPSNTLVAG